MNRMLVVVFDSENAAEAGTTAMRKLHSEGGITLYAMGVIAKDGSGTLSVKESADPGFSGAGTGLAVGALIGLLGGPAGMFVGAVAGTFAGVIRDYWVAGVGLDFVEQTAKLLQPGKVALIADVEEEWTMPVDARMEAAGGTVIRRARADVAEAQYERDTRAFKSEIHELEAEVKHAGATAGSKLHGRIAAAKASLEQAVRQAQSRVDELTAEAEAKIHALGEQLAKSQGEAKTMIEKRLAHVRSTYDQRSTKLKLAWQLTKEALAA
jgi:uncharacterized membrane protein